MTDEHAKGMRKVPTDAERVVWERLRLSQLGAKFRRQHRVAGYIVDFACLERWLVVELDGGQHAQDQAYDEKRTQVLQGLGFRVVRFWNNDVLARVDDVIVAIAAELASPPPPHPNPLRPAGRSEATEPDGSVRRLLTPRSRRGRGSRERIEHRMAEQSAQSPLPQAPVGGGGWVRGLPPKSPSPPGVSHQTQHSSASAFAPDLHKTHSNLHLRAGLNHLIRNFFHNRQVLEVETPLLSQAGNTDPNIESFNTRFSGHRDAGAPLRWLRTSPEFPLKRLLAAGIGDCYELGRVFRNGEAGRRHNPEFSMLEWYRVGWDHRQLMQETSDLVRAALALAGRELHSVTYSYRELFVEALGLDPFHATQDELAAPLAEFSIGAEGLGRDDWLDLLITHRIQPQFPRDRITLIHDYPASQCALARIRAEADPVAERFELYLGPYELANGYHELNDADEQRARFERDNARRRERGLVEVPLDENLLAVLGQMPACAGVAMGVDRLLMCLANTDDIRDVIAFPFAQA